MRRKYYTLIWTLLAGDVEREHTNQNRFDVMNNNNNRWNAFSLFYIQLYRTTISAHKNIIAHSGLHVSVCGIPEVDISI
jgi:hypothetical protein